MNTNNNYATVLVASNPDITTRVSLSSVLYSTVLLLVGILAFVAVGYSDGDRSSALYLGVMVLGAILILTGVVRLFWKMKEKVYLPTGSAIHSCSLFFAQDQLDELTELLKRGDFKQPSGLKSVPSGNVRLDLELSGDRRFAVAQLFHYVPYNYTSVTDVLYFRDEKAAEVADFVKSLRR